jgi:hypothetical protein
MHTAKDVAFHAAKLHDAFVNDREDTSTPALLLGGAAINLARIADAVEKLVKDNPDPLAPTSLRSLTTEERAIIEALRGGLIQVTRYTDAHGDKSLVVEGSVAIPRD